MLKSIIRKEILSNLFSYKFSIITILSAILIVVSIFVMYRDYCLAKENHDILRRESDEGVEIIPPTPLGIFTKGLDENLCRSFKINFEGIDISNEKQKSVNDLFKLFTAPDLLYIIKVILSLCAMLFSYDMVCGEKETGTLRQMISNTVKRPLLIIGGWVGGFLSFILPFFMAVLLGTIYVTLSPMVEINSQDWAKLGLFLLSGVIYLAAFFSLGLLISCLAHRSSTSLFISLFVWAILVFLVPNLGNILARQLVEVPTVQHLELKHRRNWLKGEFEYRRTEDPRRKGIIIKRMMEEIDNLNEDYRNRFNRLIKVSQNITRFSPAASFTFLATDIMGTGMAEERRLKRAVLQLRNILVGGLMNENRDEKSKPPVFNYRRSSVKEILGRGGLGNFLILVLFNILFFSGAYVAFLRYDVR